MEENFTNRMMPDSFAIIVSGFIADSLAHVISWLIVSFCVVMCDLAFGVRKSFLMNEEVRFSTALRRTIGKLITYFAFVCMVVTINIASGSKFDIDIYSCLLVCFIEFCSILSNILKPKGYSFNAIKAAGVIFGKVANIDKSCMDEVITKDKEGDK